MSDGSPSGAAASSKHSLIAGGSCKLVTSSWRLSPNSRKCELWTVADESLQSSSERPAVSAAAGLLEKIRNHSSWSLVCTTGVMIC